jgi:hypothetical protein
MSQNHERPNRVVEVFEKYFAVPVISIVFLGCLTFLIGLPSGAVGEKALADMAAAGADSDTGH